MQLSAKPKIGIDLMGGDTPPKELLSVLLDQLKSDQTPYSLIFYCDDQSYESLSQLLFDRKSAHHSFELISKKTYISLEDPPLAAVKSKKDSTLWQGLTDLKEQTIEAFISLGNTGALLAISHFCLKLLPSVSRAALLTQLPTAQQSVTLMDVGANTSATPNHLLEFAFMGSAYLRALGKTHFKVGLLNIGSEEHKGTQERKDAYNQIKELHQNHPDLIPHFIGNIEPQDVFNGHCDLVITDGFSGNIFLKSAEGTSQLILKTLHKKAPAILSQEQLLQLIQKLSFVFEHAVHPGALLTGVDGIVIKCHSYFDGKAIYHAIKHAKDLIEGDFIEKIKKILA
ncbi:MAG: phosphate acyltransferase PlsX [Chlamydiae bacterium]|nr:phosphate acyltransferase PlsX [Chlamydiota bacterium]